MTTLRNICLVALGLLAAPMIRAADPEPLPVEQAFRYQVEPGADTVRLQWDIEDGYYLYRKRFAFRQPDARNHAGRTGIPRGRDPRRRVFRRKRDLPRPLRDRIADRAPGRRPDIAAAADQESGLRGLRLVLSTADLDHCGLIAGHGLTGGGSAALLDLIKRDSAYGEFLPPDEAFRLTVTPLSRDWVEFDWQIEPGYYLYRHSLEFRVPTGRTERGRAADPGRQEEER